MHAVILSGAGRNADPWHPFAETSERLAELARAAGFDVDIVQDPLDGLAALADDVSLVIVNAGDPDGPGGGGEAPTPADPAVVARAATALDAAIERGVGILAVHAAASTLRELPYFEAALGARWVHEHSWHPPIGDAIVHVVGNHRIAEGLADFAVFDERYTDLVLVDVIEPIAEHEEGGVRHPLVWAREFGRSRLVYTALGHDERSYASPGNLELLARAFDWLKRVPAPSAALLA
ncbi:ThuA domain-containing protein [Agromyces protaetiae]|nr:ThuA domain-containing protein [Agromyces protaetiae]